MVCDLKIDIWVAFIKEYKEEVKTRHYWLREGDVLTELLLWLVSPE